MKPTGAHREELVDELLLKERTIAKLKDKLKADTKLQREKIGALEDRRDELLDLLDGREHVQPELPILTPGRDGKKGAPPKLKWRKEGENQVADAPGFQGVYCVEPMASGRVAVFWTPTGGSSKRLGEAASEAIGKSKAFEHALEAGADAILENAGDGKLTAKGRRKLKAVESQP